MHRFTGTLVAVVVLCMSQFAPGSVSARDDGRYANEPLHAWFDQLASGKGLCCSFADGVKVEDGHIVMPDLPGIGFEGKSDLYIEMKALAS